MKPRWIRVIALVPLALVLCATASENIGGKTVYVIPIREEISTPLTYLVRRGVKQAIEAKADLLLLDMDTNGGRLDSTEEIISSLNQFKGETVTYVNKKAFSAGAFISVATQKIFMAPQSVIGAAAPILMSPGGGIEKMPDTVEAKMTSGVRALVRTSAEKNGYNTAVIEAMIDRNREVKIDGEVLNEKGQILTLTNLEAEKEHGNPPKPLLSSGTVDSLDALLGRLGFTGAKVVRIEPTGAEQLATWLTAIGPLLLLAGIIGTYIEMKTPGFGLPGIVGIVSFALYFLGGYVAGLSGLEWTVVFVIGLALFILELFVFPGTLLIGFIGAGLMLAALVMAMVDVYPGMPMFPAFGLVRESLFNVLLTIAAAIIVMIVLSRYLLKTPLFNRLVAQGASGTRSAARIVQTQSTMLGELGVALSTLRPGGKAQFGQKFVDVITQGDLIERGAKVRIVGFSGSDAVVEELEQTVKLT
jgi:membrane-bound serine protease (ClpP class)